jgi:hypothetical protein
MYASLMAMAVVSTAAGVGMVVFGIPINAFSLGNTLIVSGVTAICGGLVLVGLAAAYRQLRRIADAMNRTGPRVPRPLDLADQHAGGSGRTSAPATARIPLPPYQTEGHGDFRAAEPHAPNYTDSHTEPRPPYRAEMRTEYAPEPRSKFSVDARSEPSSDYGDERHAEMRPESRYAHRDQRGQSRYAQQPARSSPADYAGERRARAASTNRGERDGYEPDAGYAAESGPHLRLPASIAAVFGPRPRAERAEPVHDASTPRVTAPLHGEESPARQAAVLTGDQHETQPQPAPVLAEAVPQAGAPEAEPDEPEFTTVLKSGVVDGLAYTLYADGSIAAELPGGRRRFASIDELRAHLEQDGE